MAEIQLLMPEMGESVTDATITSWLVSEGDKIEADQDILEVATDKVDTEVPSPVTGVIQKILHHPGETIAVGKPLAIIEAEGDAPNIVASPAVAEQEIISESQETVTEDKLKHPDPPYVPSNQVEKTQTAANVGDRFYSPLVRSIAKEEGLSQAELDSLQGTGLEGRVTKDDIKNYLKHRSNGSPLTTATSIQASSAVTPPKVHRALTDEVVEMDRMRKLIADHMVMSKQVSPHVTIFAEADVTNLVLWRNNNKVTFQKREGEKLTYTPLFMEAVVQAIKDFPGINVSVDGNSIIYKKDINIGMATALPSGNLIVPVIKKAGTKSLVGLAKDVNDLANRARSNKLQPDDITQGTFTITNIGTFNSLMGTPIINQPQVAIIAVGAIKKKPVVIETPSGDMIGIRHMMYLSLAMDHRVVDGALGGKFLQRVQEYLENWDLNRAV